MYFELLTIQRTATRFHQINTQGQAFEEFDRVKQHGTTVALFLYEIDVNTTAQRTSKMLVRAWAKRGESK